MTTIMAPAGLVNLKAPLPTPRQFDLLSAATLVTPETNRWLAGAWTGGDVPGPAYTHDPCAAGTNRVKMGAGDIQTQMSGRFGVYQPGFCTAQSIGPDSGFWTDRLEQVFKVYEGAAVERVLVNGDGHSTLGPYLGDPNMEVLGGGTVGAIRGMEVLENEIAKNGTGIIHCSPGTFVAWDSLTLVEAKGNVMYTGLGTKVAVGAGYIGSHPDGTGAPAADQEWAYASGPIEIYRDTDITMLPETYAQAIDRSLNDVLFIAERPYLINWMARSSSGDDDHIQAGVLIDLVP